MEIKHEKNRVYAGEESGGVLGEVTFPDCADGVVVIDRTFVAPELRGRSLASDLMRAAYDEIKSQGKKACLECPYAVKWFGRHPEARDIMAADPMV